MASGSFNISKTSGSNYLTFTVYWSAYSNGSAANSSNVYVDVYVSKSSSSTADTYSSNVSTTVSVCGVPLTESKSFRVSPGGSVLLFRKTWTNALHNTDGTKSTVIDVSVSSSVMSASGNSTVTFDTIPRQATILTAPDFNDEGNPTITYSNPAGNSVTGLKACIANTAGSIVYVPYRDISKTGTSYTFNLTAEERNALRNACANSNTMKVLFYVSTLIGDTWYYSRLEKTLTIVNATPTLEPTVIDRGSISTKLTENNQVMIKGYNGMYATANATAYKGASITSYRITNGNKTVNAATAAFDYTNSNVFKFEITDSRGNTASKTITLDLINYIKTSCKLNISNPSVDGTFNFKIVGNYYDGSFGAVDNNLNVQYRIKKAGVDWGPGDLHWVNAGVDFPEDMSEMLGENVTVDSGEPVFMNGTYEASVNITGLDYRTTYVVQARASDEVYVDYISTSEYSIKCKPGFDWGPDDFDFHVPVFRDGNPMGYYPIGGIYTSSDNTNPGELFGGTWELERRFYGGELLAYGTAWNSTDSPLHCIAGTDYGISDVLGGVYSGHLCNYLPDILTSSSGTIWVQTKGVVGLVEATIEISGATYSSGCYGIWFRPYNKNQLPTNVILTGGGGLMPIVNSYSGASTRYFYNVADSDTGTDFYVNPCWHAYGGDLYPAHAAIKSTLQVKAYAKGKVTYMWKRVA